MKIISLLAAAAISLSLLSACASGGSKEKADTLATAEICAESDYTDEALAWADSVMRTLTLEERVGQLFMPSVYASADPYTLRHIRAYIADCHIGGLVLLKGDLESTGRLADTLQSISSVGLFLSIDAEWGLAMRLQDAPRYPANGRLDPGIDDQTLYDYGREVARECRRAGINMLLGPVVDVVAPGTTRVIGLRSFGADPHRVADLAVAYARGAEDGNVVTVAKHFPGHGSPAEDSHKRLPSIDRSLHQLDSIDLYPFRKYVDAQLSGVMVGHLAVPAIDSHQRSAAVSDVVIRDLLRRDLGFKGLVITDALNMGAVMGHDAADALSAGADIILSPSDTRREIASVLDAIQEGRLSVEDINERCRRVLFYKYRVGLDHPGRVDLQGLNEEVNSLESKELQQRLTPMYSDR